MNFNQIHTVYFIGVGGIGMSALARYFKDEGKRVLGYDKTQTKLCQQLELEGVSIHYEDWGEQILSHLNKADTLVVYTPAIPIAMKELQLLKENGFQVIKRARALGIISHAFETFAVAGTHGKTTTSSILAHVLFQTPDKCNAFIGGISSNYNSNCVRAIGAKRVVVEADEFDRSFLQLKPNYAIITSTDADHLDIYGDGQHLEESFVEFINLIHPSGILLINKGIGLKHFSFPTGLKIKTYSFSENANWEGRNLRYQNGKVFFDIQNENQVFQNVEFGLPGKHNAENALAVFALCIELGIDEKAIRKGFSTYLGVKRRFDFHIRKEDMIVIDDYAHHPTEINAFLNSVKELYPTKKVTAVFQPHLFSRTHDFMNEFAEALSLADNLFLLDIYPARELPIDGVSSKVLLDKIRIENKVLSSKDTIVADLAKGNHELVVIVGAGDIDTCIEPIVNLFSK